MPFLPLPRIKSLEEVSAETDCVLNFDLDTLFLGSAVPLLEEITAEQKSGILGVSERENRDKWMKQMDTKVCLVAWEYASLAIQFAVRRIKTFNGFCGVNYHSDFICNLQSLVHTPNF